jgi:hypothetical protein
VKGVFNYGMKAQLITREMRAVFNYGIKTQLITVKEVVVRLWRESSVIIPMVSLEEGRGLSGTIS